MTITLRFVAGDDVTSRLIQARGGVCMPFTPCHVECLSRDGKSYTGQHLDGGMEARPIGYDAGTRTHELLLPLPATDEQYDAFHKYVETRIGQPYDWKAIADFVLPVNFHQTGHAFCSAVMTLAMRAADWFPSRSALATPAHQISPRDLLLMLSGIVEIAH